MRITLLFIVLGLVFGCLNSTQQTTTTMPEVTTTLSSHLTTITQKEVYWKSCEKHSECIIVNDNHCSCNESGVRTSINKKYEDLWRDKIRKESVSCPQAISNDWTCGTVGAVCIDGKCMIVNASFPGGQIGSDNECNIDLNMTECEKAGGKWGGDLTSDIFPDGYCECPSSIL